MRLRIGKRWRTASAALLACALIGPPPAVANADDRPASFHAQATETPVGFQKDPDSGAHRIIAAVSFLAALALAGGVTIYLARKGTLSRIRLAVDANPIRVIGVRRVSSRLTLVKVQIDAQRTVVIADNGSHLLLVADDIQTPPETRNA